MRRALPVALLVLVLVLAGCGSGSSHGLTNVSVNTSASADRGQKTFSAKGMSIHFLFPDSFRVIQLTQIRHTAGKTRGASKAAIGIGPLDLLVIAHYPGALRRPLTRALLAPTRRYFNALISKLAGRSMSGVFKSLDGRYALVYPPIPVSGLPAPVTAQVVNVFDGRDEYELQCQATAAGLARIKEACAEAVGTMTFSP